MLSADIRDEWGYVESGCTRDTVAQIYAWYKEHGIDFGKVAWVEGREYYTYRRAAQPVKTIDHSAPKRRRSARHSPGGRGRGRAQKAAKSGILVGI